MLPQGCPPRDRLHDYLHGLLDENQGATLAEHLRSCPHCQTLAIALQHDQTSRASCLSEPSPSVELVDDPPSARWRQQLAPTAWFAAAPPPAVIRAASDAAVGPARGKSPPLAPTPARSRPRRAADHAEAGRPLPRKESPAWLKSWLTSIIFHTVLLTGLALCVVALPPIATSVVSLISFHGSDVGQLSTFELATMPEELTEGAFGSRTSSPDQDLAARVVTNPERLFGPRVSLEGMGMVGQPEWWSSPAKLWEPILPGAAGESQKTAKSYDVALHTITRELLTMLEQQTLLVIWSFDESVSMNDDRQAIRDMLRRVFVELQQYHSSSTDHLLKMVVTSFGGKLHTHTRQPTTDLDTIRNDIDLVPTDESGIERPCSTVVQLMQKYRPYAIKRKWRIVVILVTDESGELADNEVYLEQAIRAAREAGNATVFVLGREAVFGCRYAQVNWVDEQGREGYSAQITRGPESAYPEQLQIDGIGTRQDAYPSGFGPFDLRRLAHATRGKFFILPDTETSLFRFQDQWYLASAVREYEPNVGQSREAYREAVLQSPLRRSLMETIALLDPHRPEVLTQISLCSSFPVAWDESGQAVDWKPLMQQVQSEILRTHQYATLLGEQIQKLQRLAPHREQEDERRWQANYDLLYAQLVAYQIRTLECCASLRDFIRQGQFAQVELSRPPNLRLTEFALMEAEQAASRVAAEAEITQAQQLFHAVVESHPGTPWAARALWEQQRPFSMQLKPNYFAPRDMRSINVPKKRL